MKLWLPWRRERETSTALPEVEPLPVERTIDENGLGPGRWRWRRSMGQPKFRVHRGDGTVHTKPPLSKRRSRRRTKKRPTQPQHQED